MRTHTHTYRIAAFNKLDPSFKPEVDNHVGGQASSHKDGAFVFGLLFIGSLGYLCCGWPLDGASSKSLAFISPLES